MTFEDPQSPPSLDALQTASQPTSPAAPRLFPVRALVTSREAGIIIGKGGRNVQEIREQTGARINITELVERSVERVLAITGTPEAVAKSFSLIASKLVEEANNNAQNTASQPTDVATIRLLVPHNRMGAIIGKAGQKIKEIQETSKTRVVASDQTLPNSNDRAVAVTGTPEAIYLCLNQVASILEETGGVDRNGIGLGQQQMYRPGAMNMDARRFGSPPSPTQASPGTGIQTQHLAVPVDMVGCIIGKGGSKINELRQLSGAQIRISDAAESSEERVVSVTGSPEATQMALYLLYSRLEAEKKKMVQKLEKPVADLHLEQH